MAAIIRTISPTDNPSVARLIRTVMPEFGAGGKGFAIHDPEVDDMFGAYCRARSAYFVCEEDGKILGGGGVAPLQGGPADTCELKKMYFLTAGRGRGLGQQILTSCLKSARQFGFEWCYIETFNTMEAAMRLYEKNGFERGPGPMGNTGHFACDTFYVKGLAS
ncbi:MAG TPA: GNAT family N-acetyltransferase [Chryseosolibacter sp.]